MVDVFTLVKLVLLLGALKVGNDGVHGLLILFELLRPGAADGPSITML